MIEESIYTYLTEKQTIPVYLERPKTPPTKYYLIEKTGGDMVNHIYHSTMIIQSYGASLYEAASLNEDIIDTMLDAISLGDVAKVSLNNNYNFTDPETSTYRYQAVFDIVHY